MLDLYAYGKYNKSRKFQEQHLRMVRNQCFRTWKLPQELRYDKDFIEFLNQYILTKELLDGKIEQAINQGHIKDISNSGKRRIGGRPRISFKTNA